MCLYKVLPSNKSIWVAIRLRCLERVTILWTCIGCLVPVVVAPNSPQPQQTLNAELFVKVGTKIGVIAVYHEHIPPSNNFFITRK